MSQRAPGKGAFYYRLVFLFVTLEAHEYYVGGGDPISPNDMLRALADIWTTCIVDYPTADHAEILRHIEALQLIIFGLET